MQSRLARNDEKSPHSLRHLGRGIRAHVIAPAIEILVIVEMLIE